MPKENKYDGASPSRHNNMTTNQSALKKTPGVYDRNPDPGLSEYGHSMGPNTVPIKFAETISSSGSNKMDSAVPGRMGKKAPTPTTSRINKKKNRYDRVVQQKGIGKI